MNKDFKLKGHLAMLGANTTWGMMAPIAKIVMTAGVISPLLLTNFRIIGAALLFWTASIFTKYEHVPLRDLCGWPVPECSESSSIRGAI